MATPSCPRTIASPIPAARRRLSLRNEADWDYFQSELDRADLVVLGRLGHRPIPMPRIDAGWFCPARRADWNAKSDAWWWNPAEASWREATRILLPDGGRVAVPGGQAVFDLFSALGYEAFHLSRAGGVRCPAAAYLFAACERG